MKNNFNIISLFDLHTRIVRSLPIPDNSVVLTIDDGYEDFYRYAYPVLLRHSIPATIFVTTDFIDRKIWLWPDKLDYILKETNCKEGSIQINDPPLLIQTNNKENRNKAWSVIADHCLTMDRQQCDAFIAELAMLLGVSVPAHSSEDYKPLSWEQIVEMAENGIEIGSHTCTHSRLTNITSSEDLTLELEYSKKRIENVINKCVTAFSYPFGGKFDINDRVKACVAEAGYKCATIGYFNLNVTGDLFELKRVSAGNDMRSFIRNLYGIKVLQTFFHNRQYDR